MIELVSASVSLLDLPNELIRLIGRLAYSAKEVNALAQTCQRFWHTSQPVLDTFDVQVTSSGIYWAIQYGNQALF